MVRNISIALIAFAGLCWIGGAFVGVTHAGGEQEALTLRLLEMFSSGATTSALIAIAMGTWLKT